MKKIILLLMVMCLWGCTSPEGSHQSIPEQLMEDIKMTLPDTVYTELNNKGVYTQLGDTKIIGNEAKDPTLRLDFTYQDDKLIQYVSKEYGFVAAMNVKRIDEERAKELATIFAKTFLNQDVVLQKTTDLSGYDTGNYITFEDQNHNSYLIDINKDMIIKYEEKK